MRANLVKFLKEVVPAAEAADVRLGIHPDDPPISLSGLPRLVSTAADMRTILGPVDSPANGLSFCAGSLGSRTGNDVVGMAREFAQRINFIHLRNVSVEPDKSFNEAEHLGGDVNMVEMISVLRAEERWREAQGRADAQIPMRPDHGHLLATISARRSIRATR